MIRPNWTAFGVLALCLLAWGSAALASYRIGHEHGGLRAVYAHAGRLAHRLERLV